MARFAIIAQYAVGDCHPLPQSAVLCFQLADELDELLPLISQERQLLNLLGANKRIHCSRRTA